MKSFGMNNWGLVLSLLTKSRYKARDIRTKLSLVTSSLILILNFELEFPCHDGIWDPVLG